MSWKETNNNISFTFKAIKKYAYRPFSAGSESVIGPRTYFLIRKYLNLIQNPQYPAAYVTVFALNHDASIHVGCIDLAVGADAIYGITSCLLTQLETADDWFEKDLQVIYENTTELLNLLLG